jgi:hypothetical protein
MENSASKSMEALLAASVIIDKCLETSVQVILAATDLKLSDQDLRGLMGFYAASGHRVIALVEENAPVEYSIAASMSLPVAQTLARAYASLVAIERDVRDKGFNPAGLLLLSLEDYDIPEELIPSCVHALSVSGDYRAGRVWGMLALRKNSVERTLHG